MSFLKKSGKFLVKQIKGNVFGFTGTVVGLGLFIYNNFRPTRVNLGVVGNSALGGGVLGGSSLGLSLGAVGLFLLVIGVLFWVLAKKKRD